MANKTLFSSAPSSNNVPQADCVNAAGGKAYEFTARHKLAQIAATNTFNGTYYVDAADNLQIAKDAVNELRSDPEFVAKVAVYCRNKAYMKDMPAYLCAVLAAWGEHKLFRQVFRQVIDNGKMLRNFIQIGRSGAAGKKLNMSSGAIRHAIRDWFLNHNSEFIFRASIGNDPTMRDMLRMSRPRPESEEKAALYAYLKGADFDEKTGEYITKNKDGSVKYRHTFFKLPAVVRQYELFKKNHEGEIPNVDFRMLDSVLNKEEAKKLWAVQAQNGSWHLTRMNLNNFQKYGVFESSELQSTVAKRLANADEVRKARAYPYQLLMAYNAAANVPHPVREALQDAMEVALENVPSIEGQMYICIDTSGSMSSAVTGYRPGATSQVRCIDAAALFGAAFLRKNKNAELLPFDTSVHTCKLNGRDTVLTNAKTLAGFGGGGTDCSCAMKSLNARNAKGDTVIFVSDNESWVDNNRHSYYGSVGTGLMGEWMIYKKRNPNAKLICIDMTPAPSAQVKEHKDILQVGGFGDQVFDVIASFINYGSANDHWVDTISAVDLNARKSYSVEKVDKIEE